MPLFKTNRMPVRAARSSMVRGLPPLGLGCSSGKSGSITSHSSSVTSSLAMPSAYPSCGVVRRCKSRTLQVEVTENVKPGSEVHTDALASYRGLDAEYVHNVVDHAETYVRGHVHTNGLESFWSLLKRGIRGTYVSVEPYHLFRYLDEQAFRFNERAGEYK